MLVLLLASGAGATELVVCPSGCAYSSIQAAVYAASAGDTVTVNSGTYVENVAVNKQLILRGVDTGVGMPVVDASGSGNAITLAADGIVLEGFTATEGGENPNAGIKVTSRSNTLIKNNANSNKGFGITVEGSNHTLIGNNAMNNDNGIFLEQASNNNTLIGNNASNNTEFAGFFVEGSNHTLIGNYATNNDNGFFVEGSNHTLIGNNASNNTNEAGLYFFNSSNNMVRGNYATNNSIGIVLEHTSNNNTLIGNNVSNNSVGIRIILSSNNNTLIGNNVTNNFFGINLAIYNDHYTSNNTIYNNLFNNINNFGWMNKNTWNITQTPGANIVGGPNIGGNFWAQPDGNGYSQKCIDSEPDGICDLPYELDSNNIDYLPLAIYTATTPTDSIPPVINSVELNTTVPNTGDAILITVNATDNVEVTGVMANSVALTVQGGNTLTWSGTITALEGTHSVNVSATDAENNVAWNNSTSYTATTPTVTNSISGFKINDINGNGKWDAGEKGISNWTIRLIGIIGKGKNATVIRNETLTDATGFYKFDNLSAGRYFVIEKLKKGFVPTSSPVKRIKLAQGKNSMNNNFTNRPIHSWDKKDDNRDIDDYEAINRDIDKYKEDTNGD
jgi:parallel beta-helix repeat protein